MQSVTLANRACQRARRKRPPSPSPVDALLRVYAQAFHSPHLWTEKERERVNSGAFPWLHPTNAASVSRETTRRYWQQGAALRVMQDHAAAHGFDPADVRKAEEALSRIPLHLEPERVDVQG